MKEQKDMRSNVDKYSDVLMLFTLQHIIENEDSKDFVDYSYKIPKEEVIKNFNELFSNILNKFFDSKDCEFFINHLTSIKENVSFFILSEWFDGLFNKIGTEDVKGNAHTRTIKDIINTEQKSFIGSNFNENDKDIIEINFQNENKQIPLKKQEIINIYSEIIKKWTKLYRKTNGESTNHNSTLIKLDRPFIIPGGRYREIYYWDSYWIIDGLLASNMHSTAFDMIQNLVSLITDEFQFIPNGTRKYYRNRSQPPFLIQMVYNYYKQTEDENHKDQILNGNIFEAMEKEYNFWMTEKIYCFDDGEHVLNYYNIDTDYPRPESLKKDIESFKVYLTHVLKQSYTHEEIEAIFMESITTKENKFPFKNEENKFYSHIKSAAESGWDFSSRFFEDQEHFYTICTKNIIPVDLNAIMYRNEEIMLEFYRLKGNSDKETEFKRNMQKRKMAINKFLLKDKCWYDYNYVKKEHVSDGFYFSNIMPMIYQIERFENDKFLDILYYYRKELFSYKGGIPASSFKTSDQQWDFPNVWAPHQQLMVEFLLKTNKHEWATHVASSFFRSVEVGFKNYKNFFEKYDCENVGQPGGRGEYKVQEGFGWTNGVIIRFIKDFKDELIVDDDNHQETYTKICKELEDIMGYENEEKQEITDIYPIPVEN